jgi:hypothetical protein
LLCGELTWDGDINHNLLTAIDFWQRRSHCYYKQNSVFRFIISSRMNPLWVLIIKIISLTLQTLHSETDIWVRFGELHWIVWDINIESVVIA